MATLAFDFPFARPPEAALERSYIVEYLKGKGYTPEDLEKMPKEEAYQLRKEASMYASNKLAEQEARARVSGYLKPE